MKLFLKLLTSLFVIMRPIGNRLISSQPHNIFPDILHWEIDDRFTFYGNDIETYDYLGVNENGTVFYSLYMDGKYTCSIKRLKSATNQSLKNRRISESQKSTKDYMQFMRDFQQSYFEIKQ